MTMRRLYIDRPEPGLRVSDAERESAAESLRQHHADGRLTTDELEERTERAYAATTRGDLDPLFEDLPRLRAPEAERPRPRRLWPPAFAFPIVATLLVIALLTSAHVLWLAWPLMFFLFFRFMARGFWWRSRGWPYGRG